MSELPRTDDLPRSTAGSGEGYDPARVEDAFAAFGERVRELESVANELRAELHALRAARRPPAPFVDDEVWPAQTGSRDGPWPSPDWIASIPPPLARALAVPRILLEGAFLLLVALLAGLADLSSGWIVAVMTAAWALVALAEWSAAANRARWRLDEIPAHVEPSADAAAAESTGPWRMPIVHATAVEAPDGSESHTVVTTLPVEPESPEEPTGAPLVTRRGLRLWRRRSIEPTTDPWEK